MKPKIHAIIFDMDGTIVTSDHAWHDGLLAVLGKRGHQNMSTEKLAVLHSTQGLHALDTWHIIKKEFNLIDSIETLNKEHEKRVFDQLEGSMRFIPGFTTFHNYLTRNKVPTAIATNATSQGLQHITSIMKLDTFFGAHTYSVADADNKFKPKPDVFIHASEQIGVAPQYCVVFEDSKAGFLAARAAGMRCIAIKNKLNKDHLSLADASISSYDNATQTLRAIGEISWQK